MKKVPARARLTRTRLKETQVRNPTSFACMPVLFSSSSAEFRSRERALFSRKDLRNTS